MNQINLIGRLTKDPEIRQTQNNKSVCEFDIAVNRIGQEQTDFITCVVWEKQAENLVKYQNKGSLIAVNGALRVDKYQNQEGQNRYKTYVLATNIEYLSSRKEEAPEVSEEVQEKAEDLFGKDGLRNTPIDDSDLPF
jgi:single-strand DNA-binding protein